MKRFLTAGMALVMAAAMTLTGCGSVSSDTTLATLGDQTITYGVANFYVQYMESIYDTYYLSYYGDDMWSSDLTGSGSTMEETTRESLLDSIASMYRLDAHAEEYGITLTDEQQTQIKEAAAEFMSSNSDKALKQMGATEEIVEETIRLMLMNTLVTDAIYNAADVNVTDEEAACRTITYATISLAGTTDASGDTTELTDEEKESLRTQAADIVKEAKASDFETAVSNNNLESDTYSYNKTDTGMDQEVFDYADTLSEGEIGTVETDDSIYIIRLDSEYDKEASETKKESLITQAQQDYYDEIYSGWQDETEFTVDETVWAKVSFKHLYSIVSTSTESGDASGDNS